ncbi:MAG: HD domain-containing phosphohydrolase [Anaerolineales bacterium]
MDPKLGNGSQLGPFAHNFSQMKFQNLVPLDVRRKYENAAQELAAGSELVLFEYMLPLLAGEAWYESRLVSFTKDLSIMFIRNITRHKQRSNFEITLAYDKAVEGWSRALYLRDQETEDHTRRVTDMTLRLAIRMGISDTELVHIRRGSIMHDIGKVAIPDHILFKPAALTSEEWKIMQRHPTIAMEILAPISYLTPALAIPWSHHEKWDGSGYPQGLSGEEIPLAARLFALADVYDALTSDRPYRQAWSSQDAVSYLHENIGTHFDPQIAPTFIEMITE